MEVSATFNNNKITTVKEAHAQQFIEKYAKHLKNQGEFKIPSWSEYVKTSVAKELAPSDSDWMYFRAAAIMRHLYIRPNVGVGALRKVFSSKQRRGSAPSHSRKASSKIIRYILMEFQNLKLLSTGPAGGRHLTSNGRKELDNIANQLNYS